MTGTTAIAAPTPAPWVFRAKKTSDEAVGHYKTLLVAMHGWGKTTQASYYQRAYGPGFILSGEAGLASIRSQGIDFLPFTSFDGKHEPENDVYSFRGICKLMTTQAFKDKGYKWVMVDSLTELSDMAFTEIDEKVTVAAKGGKKDGFAVWGQYADAIIGACKWVRDLPYHVCVTALAKEDKDTDGEAQYWPMVRGQQAQKQLPGIFDNVLCGVRTVEAVPRGDGKPPKQVVKRYIVTDEIKGWHGKVRDEKRRLKAFELGGDITALLSIINMSDADFAARQKAAVAADPETPETEDEE